MKRKCQVDNGVSKHLMVECPHCSKSLRSNNLGRHVLTHNIKKMCGYCKKDVRIDWLSKHEVLCKSQVDEKICNRSVGVHQHIGPIQIAAQFWDTLTHTI